MRQVAALYVDVHLGPYPLLEGVECWGEERDARLYDGPHPVVAHPSCAWWGAMGWGASRKYADCGPRAVEQVRKFGGVLEHPARSRLWDHCRLPKPGRSPDSFGGITIVVDQCDWGHCAQKRTWLYLVRVETIPEMPPRGTPTHVVSHGPRIKLPLMKKRERHLTPFAFAKWLVEAARSVS